MIHIVDVPPGVSLDESEMHATLARPVQDLRAEARQLVPALAERRVVDNFLVFNQAACWLRLLERVVEKHAARPGGTPAGR